MKFYRKIGIFGSLICLLGLPMALIDQIGGGSGFGDIILNPTQEDFIVNSTLIGPYEPFCDDQKISFTVLYRNTGYFRPRLRVIFDENSSYFKQLPKREISSKFSSETYDFVIPTSSYFGQNGMAITFEIANQDNTSVLTSFNFTVKAIVEKTYNTSVEDKLSISQGGYVFRIEDNKINNYFEHIKNSDYKDYFDVDYYYRIPLSQFKFDYTNDLTFSLGTAELTFVDYNNCFPYLSNGGAEEISIALQVKQDGKTIYLELASEMYVHPKTLQMSFVFRKDFVLTRYFYLPINCMDLLNDSNFEITFTNFGSFKTNIVWPVKLLTNKTFLGDCNSSEYCIIGEEA